MFFTKQITSKIHSVLCKHLGKAAGSADDVKNLMSTEDFNYSDGFEALQDVAEDKKFEPHKVKMSIYDAALEDVDPELFQEFNKAKNALNGVVMKIEAKYDTRVNEIIAKYADKVKEANPEALQAIANQRLRF